MKIGQNSPEKLIEEITKLEPVEFLGVCKILGIDVYKNLEIGKVESVEADEECGRVKGKVNIDVEPKDFVEIWDELCDKIGEMNRTRRRNLGTLIYAATKKEKK